MARVGAPACHLGSAAVHAVAVGEGRTPAEELGGRHEGESARPWYQQRQGGMMVGWATLSLGS